MVVHGDGMDEFSICGPTDVMELRDGNISKHTLDYSDYGIAKARVEDLTGGTFEKNVSITRGILENTLTGPCRDVVLFNAAAAIMVAGRAAGIAEGIQAADESIKNGKALQALEKLIEISNS